MKWFAFSVFTGMAVAGWAQLPGLPGGGRLDLPGLENILFKQEDPFTSSLKDAWIGAKFLDGMAADFQIITEQDRTPEGIWKLQPGAYTAELRSFCGRGYTYGPTRGMGYATAPWLGKNSQILQNLVRRYSTSGESQESTQKLIWAILAKGKPSKFSTELKALAAKLLKPDEIRQLEGLSLDALGDDVMRRLMGKATAALRPLYEAENKVRGMAYRTNAPYSEFEKLMMREAPDDLPTTIPRGRWLWSPKGYFFRAQPKGYRQTTFEILVPRKPLVTRDDKGRITRLECPPGTITEVEWDDTKAPEVCPGDANLTMHYFKRIRLTSPDPDGEGKVRTEDRAVNGFVFKGTPSKKGSVVWNQLYASIDPFAQDWAGRLENAQEQYERYNEYREYYDRYRRIEDGRASADDFLDLSHYRDGIWAALTGGGLGWIADHHARQAEALAHATDVINTLGTGGAEVDPSEGVFMPGNPGSQRILGSSSTW